MGCERRVRNHNGANIVQKLAWERGMIGMLGVMNGRRNVRPSSEPHEEEIFGHPS
jgi:hypothetical protein